MILRRALRVGLLCLSSLVLPTGLFADQDHSVQTQFTTIRYTQDAALSDFFWRIRGQRVTVPSGTERAGAWVDELVARVEALLGMYPDAFHLTIILQPTYQDGPIAFYTHHQRSVTVAADRVTDGVLAHEIAHAVISAYFDGPLPKPMQEILAQYVDRHLWGGN